MSIWPWNYGDCSVNRRYMYCWGVYNDCCPETLVICTPFWLLRIPISSFSFSSFSFFLHLRTHFLLLLPPPLLLPLSLLLSTATVRGSSCHFQSQSSLLRCSNLPLALLRAHQSLAARMSPPHLKNANPSPPRGYTCCAHRQHPPHTDNTFTTHTLPGLVHGVSLNPIFFN